MPQPKLEVRIRRSHDVAVEVALVEERLYVAWGEIKRRLDIENPVPSPNTASTRSDIAKLGIDETFLGYLNAVLDGLRTHDIDVTQRKDA